MSPNWPFTPLETIVQIVLSVSVVIVGDHFGLVYALVGGVCAGGLLGLWLRRVKTKALRDGE